jgi:hypothetical protein
MCDKRLAAKGDLMKTWYCLLALVISLSTGYASAQSIDPDPDHVGLYADLEATIPCDNPNVGQVSIYLILTNCTSQGGIRGWECHVISPPNVYFTGYTMAGQAINVLEGPEFAVGLLVPLPWSPAIRLATLNYFLIGDPDIWLYLEPISTVPPSIPDHMAYVDGDDVLLWKVMYPSSGSHYEPVFCFNCSCQDIIRIETATWGKLKSMFR